MSNKIKTGSHRAMRAKLIFNAGSGRTEDSPQQLASIISAMQDEQMLPEVYSVQPDSDLEQVARDAIQAGIKLIVVAGGDGTIDSVIGALVGTDATLGIIPTGTRNNVAFNLGINEDIASSVAILRNGRKLKIDVGRVHSGPARHWFLEGVALGLVTDLYPMLDDIQHGNLAPVGDLFSAFMNANPSTLQINLDGEQHPESSTHMLMITNMPFVGPHFQISPEVSFHDGHLDVFTFSDMSKMNVISYAMLSGGGLLENAGIQHYRAKDIKIVSEPPMPVLADGNVLEGDRLSIHIHPQALRVMAGQEIIGTPATSATESPESVSNG